MSSVDEPTIGRLVGDISRDISALVQKEIQLAKSELRVSAKAGGIGTAMILTAAFFGLLVIVLLSIAAAYFIVMAGLDPAWAFLIVAGFYVLLAAGLILVAVRALKKIKAPEKTIATASKIPAALKGQSSTREVVEPASPTGRHAR
ncbi:MAG: phage holin family protein [Aeromicrobium sp.]|jgi:hypothetical protein|uniref:phage holin family protein n=1 Tax=Aeromicrobium sp. TaxID=1871063 RepID=UPI0026272132|nr:phage holin family protein [Aeromicrobium sp.]MCW2824748.1 phage holin family protein [Aeromicrobium sp.]